MLRQNLDAFGPISAQSFQSTVVPIATGTVTQTKRFVPQTIKVQTNGTTEVDVFAAANPISGTLVGLARITALDDANGNITCQGTSAGTTYFTIAKGSAGAVKGSVFAGVPFAKDGTLTVKSSGTGNVIVELDFVAVNPALNNTY